MTVAIQFEREDRHRCTFRNLWHVGSPFSLRQRAETEPAHACSLLPVAENGEMTFGRAAKGQANELV
jgi:hypothetical protein